MPPAPAVSAGNRNCSVDVRVLDPRKSRDDDADFSTLVLDDSSSGLVHTGCVLGRSPDDVNGRCVVTQRPLTKRGATRDACDVNQALDHVEI